VYKPRVSDHLSADFGRLDVTLRFQQKLTIPILSRPLINRAGLTAQLEQAIVSRRVVVLAAPAGWGKTSLLVEWAAQTELRVAWYTLDAADHDPHRFLDYLLHTVAPFVPHAAELAARIDSSFPQNLAEIGHEAALLIADAPLPFALVIDDLQLLTDGPVLPGSSLVTGLLASLIEYAHNCHLVLASRTVPDLRGLVRLVAQQRAAIFDYALLQFSSEEVQQLAEIINDNELSSEHAEALSSQFKGWVTGIVLYLDRSSQGQYQFSFNGVSDTNKVYAYFAEQVVAPLDPAFQRFLEDSSIFEDLSPERCDLLRNSNDSRDFLEQTLRHSLFVSMRGSWLSYHSLFRDFLRERLAQDSQRYKRLLLRAAEIYRDEEDLLRALDCYLASDSYEQAIQLLHDFIPRFRQRSLHSTILACLNRMEKIALLPPDLLLEQARVYSDLALWEEAFSTIDLAETLGDDTIRQAAQITNADLHFLSGKRQEAQAILDTVESETLAPTLRISYVMVKSRLLLAKSEVAQAITILEEALQLSSSNNQQDKQLIGTITDMLGLAYARQGDRRAAQRYLRRADACWRVLGNMGRRAMTLNNLGMLALEELRFHEARSAFSEGLENARHTSRRRTEATLHCSMAELELYQANFEQANKHFEEAYNLAMRFYIVQSAAIAALGAWWTSLIAGDKALAERWSRPANEAKTSGSPELAARLLLAQRRSALLGWSQEGASASGLEELKQQSASLPITDKIEYLLQQAAQSNAKKERAQFLELSQQVDLLAQQLSPKLREKLLQPYQLHFQTPPQAASHPSSAPLKSAPALSHWQISALGIFECNHDGTSYELSPIYQALLVRLLDAGPGGMPVERLWEAVWGETDLSMTALHQALRRLRTSSALAASARDGICAIRTPWEQISYDVYDFEQALRSAHTLEELSQAAELYRGDFLPSAPFSASLWATARRDHLQQRYLDLLEQLGTIHEEHAPQKAINYYQQLLQIDGCREQTAVRLMQIAAQHGNRSLVHSTYEYLGLALRTLSASPSQTTHELYRRLVVS
jgi:LuxR family maltose regulon positive regulatory protein